MWKRKGSVEAYQFDGTLESVYKISTLCTTKVVIERQVPALVDVFVGFDGTYTDDGYRTLSINDWVVQEGKTIRLYSNGTFRREFESTGDERSTHPHRYSGWKEREGAND